VSADDSPLPIWIYRLLLFVGGAAFVAVGWAYQVAGPSTVDPLAGRLAIGLSALSLGTLTFTSATIRGKAYVLVYGLFALVSAWQIYVATVGGLTPTAAFGVLLVFLGCSAGIQTSRWLATYTVFFVGTMALAAYTLEAPGVPRGAFLATLSALGALGVFVTRPARRRSRRSTTPRRRRSTRPARSRSSWPP